MNKAAFHQILKGLALLFLLRLREEPHREEWETWFVYPHDMDLRDDAYGMRGKRIKVEFTVVDY